MRATLRRLASVKPVRYLEAGNPTGLTGLQTHPSPRAALLFLYSTTLDRLKTIPETSLYRQSVEGLTKHRLSLVEAAKPEGYDAWAEKASKILESVGGKSFSIESKAHHYPEPAFTTTRNGSLFVVHDQKVAQDPRDEEWDGVETEELDVQAMEGSEGAAKEGMDKIQSLAEKAETQVKWEDEPMLTIDQIEELENKIGAGLIEEVVQVAENELRLIDTMKEYKVWEDLEEKPAEGQWTYFERKP